MALQPLEPRAIGAVIATIACAGIGTFVYAKNRAQAMCRYFAYFNFSIAIWNIGELFVLFTKSDPGLALVLDRVSTFGAAAMIPWYFRLIISVTEKANIRQRAKAIADKIFSICFVVFSICLPTALIIKEVHPPPDEEVPGLLFIPFAIYLVAGLGVGIYEIMQAYFVSPALEKNRLKYFFFAFFIGGIAAGNYFLSCVYTTITPTYHYLEISYVLILAYAILKHRLMDVAVIIRKTLIYSLVTSSLMVIYLVAISISAHIFQGMAGYQTVFSSSIAAGLIAFCFQPLRKRVQFIIDTKFFRQYVDREEKLYELSREVITHTTPEAMGQALMRVLQETIHPKGGVLFVKQNGDFMPAAIWGEAQFQRMDEDNPLARYFQNHPQPFVQELEENEGASKDTRMSSHKERPAA